MDNNDKNPEKTEEKKAENPKDKKLNLLQKKLESRVIGMLKRKGKDSGKTDMPESDAQKDTGKVEEKKASEKDDKKTSADNGKGEEKEENPEEVKKDSEENPEDKGPTEEPADTKTKDDGNKKEKKEEKEKKEKAGKTGMPKESLSDLVATKEEIEALLSSIEDSYREATIPDKTYHEVKDKNEHRLDGINKKIQMINKAEKLAKETVPAETAPAEKPEAAAPASPAEPAPKQPAAAQPAPTTPAPAPAPAEPAKPEPKPSETKDNGDSKPDHSKPEFVKVFEAKIEEKLKSVIASANVELTDKRLKKLEERIDPLELDIKELKRTSETVSGYDKQFSLMTAEVEKTKALVESAKEAKNIMDEKVQRITESFAEIRSIVYQREAISKEQEVMFDKLKETVSHIDSARILKEFTTRDEQLKDVNTRIEKLERSAKMTSESMNKIQGLMTDVGSLENIIKASKMVGEKLERIQEIEEKVKASSTRLDSIFVEMKKRLDEFNTYKVNQDKLNQSVTELNKTVEDFARRQTDFSTKSDIDTMKTEIINVKKQATEAAQAAKSAPAQATATPEVASLNEEKEEIETLLSTLEENLKNKEISQEEYDKAKASNLKKIADIEEKIKKITSGAASTGKEDVEEQLLEPATGKHKKVMLLAKLRESYEKGEISKSAYDKSKKLMLRK